MKSKIFVIFLCNFLCISAADEQFYLHDDFIVNLDFDCPQDLDLVQNNQDLLLDDVDEFDLISNCFDNILMKDLIEKIIGKNVKNDNKPIENLITAVDSWRNLMSPEEFIDILDIIKNIGASDAYNNLQELQSACRNITRFIINFIKMPSNSSQAQFFVEQHAVAWQEWVATMHQYL